MMTLDEKIIEAIARAQNEVGPICELQDGFFVVEYPLGCDVTRMKLHKGDFNDVVLTRKIRVGMQACFHIDEDLAISSAVMEALEDIAHDMFMTEVMVCSIPTRDFVKGWVAERPMIQARLSKNQIRDCVQNEMQSKPVNQTRQRRL